MLILIRLMTFILLLGTLFVSPSLGAPDKYSVPTPEKLAQLEEFHGHVCGGSLFGARLGLAAKEAIRATGAQGKLKAQYFDISCPVDGIQVFAGTTCGNAALTVVDQDEHRLVLSAKESKHYVEATLTTKALEKGRKSRELRKQSRKLPENSAQRQALEQEIKAIFAWLSTAPTEEIVSIISGQEN